MTSTGPVASPPVIDTHTHHLPIDARDLLAGSSGGGPRVAALRSLPDDSPMLRLDERLAEMDRLGIDVAVLAIPPVGLLPDHGLLRELMATANDGIVAACRAHPERFVMLASLPLPDAVTSVAEIDRLAGEPAVRGVTFPSQATLHRPDQIGLEAVLARASSSGLVTLIHPSGASTELGSAFEDFGLGLSLHAMVSGPLVVARLIASGCLDRLPDAEVIVPSLGGVLPFVAPRLDDRLTGSMARTPSDYLRSNVFYDNSAMPAGPAFRCTLETVGVSQILFGTDYPSWAMTPALSAVSEMGLEPAEQAAVLGGNAARWFDPGTARPGPSA